MDAFLTWNVVGTQMPSEALQLSCEKKGSSRMLKQESFSSPASQTGVTHMPSVLSLHPIVCAPCLCWLMYLPSIEGRGNFKAVKTNMPEEG